MSANAAFRLRECAGLGPIHPDGARGVRTFVLIAQVAVRIVAVGQHHQRLARDLGFDSGGDASAAFGEARIVERAFGLGPCALAEAMAWLQDRLANAET